MHDLEEATARRAPQRSLILRMILLGDSRLLCTPTSPSIQNPLGDRLDGRKASYPKGLPDPRDHAQLHGCLDHCSGGARFLTVSSFSLECAYNFSRFFRN